MSAQLINEAYEDSILLFPSDDSKTPSHGEKQRKKCINEHVAITGGEKMEKP